MNDFDKIKTGDIVELAVVENYNYHHKPFVAYNASHKHLHLIRYQQFKVTSTDILAKRFVIEITDNSLEYWYSAFGSNGWSIGSDAPYIKIIGSEFCHASDESINPDMIKSKSNGMYCSSCNEFNKYAEINNNGKYTCYSCRYI